jgi:D-glycero-D-manno-heptose 1,7-bisphosphate phosphatase
MNTSWLDVAACRHIPATSRLINGSLYPRSALFLDRDGVVIEDVHFLTDSSKVQVLDGVREALPRLQTEFSIVIVTNQSGIARGYLTEADLLILHTAILNALEGCAVDAIYYCPHLPGAPLATYDQECECRKPKPGMLLRAAQEWGFDLSRSFMVGDVIRDVEAGVAAGVSSYLVGNHNGQSDYPYAANLAAVAPLIMTEFKTRRQH